MKIFALILIFLSCFNAKAGHIIGGEIYYDYVGNNNYTFHISMYKDCDPSQNWAPFDQDLILVVYSGGVQFSLVQIPFPGFVVVPVTYDNPCVTAPPGLCIQNAIYSTTINLPNSPNGYTVSYQRCCRKPTISNIVNPGDVGFTLTCQVPAATADGYHLNSSPRFTNYPPSLLCNNDDLVHDQSATDLDGDQLVYSLVTPYRGGSTLNPAPVAAPPPYAPIPWVGGFSAPAPLGPGAQIAINPNTGLLTASPNLTGLFVIGIRVQELRNGVVISETVLDFLFQVFACNISLQANLPGFEDLPTFVSYCEGLNVQFVNESWGTNEFLWDFGVPGADDDTSSISVPSFTYPAPGIYTVTLVANPNGVPCTDTAQMIVNVNNELETEWFSTDSICFIDNSFDFISTTSGPPGTTFEWDFGTTSNQQFSSNQNVNGIEFSSDGFISISVNAAFNVCSTTFTDSIYIFPEPEAIIILPADLECGGLIVDFENNSAGALFYDWDFGVLGISSDISTNATPTYAYPGPGIYEVSLITGSSPVCLDTGLVTIEINEKLVVDFTSQDSLCFSENSFDFIGETSGPIGAIYTWNFGSLASPSTSTNTSEFDVSFQTVGEVSISLTGTFENCTETVNHPIYIFQDPEVNFIIEDGLQCEPFLAQFTDLSFAETGISYQWDFGDGNTSILQNPTNVYSTPGPYPVTLTISTAEGCIATLALTQQDIVVVRPKPTSDFSINPEGTDICDSRVNFMDNSILGDNVYYWFDDSSYTSLESNPSWLYLTDGSHRPMQIVTTDFGCKDTSYQQLYIEPFTIYVPNSFTPDGNEFNNRFIPIVYLEALEWKLEIYDRWGELIFESHDIETGWDGTTPSGKIGQDGQYIWKITYVSCAPNGEEEMLVGTINLLK